ncbi:Cof-type HAD-IIB family hydrolase [Caldalkalibacillus mannanilyticus]|uniref:Cof-type HAD-IIB family hydrolase n=1 Tax=Caldalkalibacillus mannanilyticus TaxID=1418 RepID=UPI000469BF54|nr:Cof-type HAD-IIB family hydrolase [Caldalkalibacillus mannanilyticus]
MTYKIVFFDIDGTLVDEEKRIPEDTKEAIRRLQQTDTIVAIATGRATWQLKEIVQQLEIDSFVCFNGACAIYQGETIFEKYIDAPLLTLLEKRAQEKKHPLVYMNHDEYWTNMDRHPYVEEAFANLRTGSPAFLPEYSKEALVHQVMLHCPVEEEEEYHQLHEELCFVRWHPYSMDILLRGVTKAKGIEMMLQHLGISPEEAIAFGDALNDREMLTYVGMGIAMGNALDEVKSMANMVTRPVDAGGIKYALEQLHLI